MAKLLGGTLSQLAQERGTSVEELQKLNPNLRADTTYSVGDVKFGSPSVPSGVSYDTKTNISTTGMVDSRNNPNGLRAIGSGGTNPIGTSGTGLTKVPTGSTGPDGKPQSNIIDYTRKGNDVYDAQGNYVSFAQAQKLGIVDQLVNIPQQAPELPFDTKADGGGVISDSGKEKAATKKVGSDIQSFISGLVSQPTTGVSETTKTLLEDIKKRQATLDTRQKEDLARIEEEYKLGKEELTEAQLEEKKIRTDKTYNKGFVFSSEVEQLEKMEQQHRREQATLLSQKTSVIQQSQRAFEDSDFKLAQSLLTTAKDIEDTAATKEKNYFDNIVKAYDLYEKLNKPVVDLEKKEQDQVLEWMSKAPDAFLGVTPADLAMGGFSYGEAQAAWLKSDAYKREVAGDIADIARKEQLASGGGGDNTIKLTSTNKMALLSAGFSSSEISQIQNDVSQFGLDAVLEGIDEEEQKKAIQDVYGVKQKVTREQIKATVTQKVAQDGLKENYTRDELIEFAKDAGFASFWLKRDTEIENYLNSSSAKKKYAGLLYEQYKQAGMAE